MDETGPTNVIANELRRDADRHHFVPRGHKGGSYAPFDNLAAHIVETLSSMGYRIVDRTEFELLQGADTDAVVNRDTANRLQAIVDRIGWHVFGTHPLEEVGDWQRGHNHAMALIRAEFDQKAEREKVEIVPAGTSAAMGAFAAGSVTKQRVLEDIAYVLTGWRYEEPEDTWAAVAQVARNMGNAALVRAVEDSYAAGDDTNE